MRFYIEIERNMPDFAPTGELERIIICKTFTKVKLGRYFKPNENFLKLISLFWEISEIENKSALYIFSDVFFHR